MKKFQLLFIFLLSFATTASAQKIGVVDTDYILGKLPQYKEAEARLNEQITNWQNEIQTLQTDFEKKRTTLENEKVLLIGDQLKLRQKEVDDLDKRIKAMINNRFGSMGEINNARSNLTKPFQDLIWGAIKTVSEKNTLGIVLDKSNNISVIFLDKRYDYTDKVLDLLLKNAGTKKTESDQKPTKKNAMDMREEKMKVLKAEENQRSKEQSKAKEINKSTRN